MTRGVDIQDVVSRDMVADNPRNGQDNVSDKPDSQETGFLQLISGESGDKAMDSRHELTTIKLITRHAGGGFCYLAAAFDDMLILCSWPYCAVVMAHEHQSKKSGNLVSMRGLNTCHEES